MYIKITNDMVNNQSLNKWGLFNPVQHKTNRGKSKMANKPVEKYRNGGVTVTVWKNVRKKDNQEFEILDYQIDKNYKDGEEWKTTNHYSMEDLNKLLAVLVKVTTEKVKNE